ncbi:hypothetical protein PHAVU_008G245500 [Phaseolus vulgaris]|uniref:Uncharacterized protein n=1 Tax=Phaseolus vulgaris TaxID=3885 RepID=V7B8V1_PHAVU|nr:hypothetical protein PHAVU_008G245500g [Phaseolus vulgaris]ESW14010.1 hypothetical protein PHAVU_008G245500g [Phaseolus vulgaris]
MLQASITAHMVFRCSCKEIISKPRGHPWLPLGRFLASHSDPGPATACPGPDPRLSTPTSTFTTSSWASFLTWPKPSIFTFWVPILSIFTTKLASSACALILKRENAQAWTESLPKSGSTYIFCH